VGEEPAHEGKIRVAREKAITRLFGRDETRGAEGSPHLRKERGNGKIGKGELAHNSKQYCGWI